MLSVPGLPARYRVYRELGRGGQGVVYHAHDDVLDADVALKVLHAHLAGDADVVERLRREGVLTRRIKHRGVCRVHDLVTHEGTVFLVMDYVDGTALQIVIYKDPPSPEESVRIVKAAADAVAAAHAAGVVHRDLKPQNILVKPDGGGVVVVDFGVATAHDLPKMTVTGLVVGTRAYIAPEIWLGAPATALADVFAMGIILYESLTGNVPYGDVDPLSDLVAVPPSHRKAAIPAWLDVVTAKAMAPLPKDRFQSMRAFVDALDSAGATIATAGDLARDTIENPPARPPRARIAVAGAAGVVAAAAVAVAVVVALPPSAPAGVTSSTAPSSTVQPVTVRPETVPPAKAPPATVPPVTLPPVTLPPETVPVPAVTTSDAGVAAANEAGAAVLARDAPATTTTAGTHNALAAKRRSGMNELTKARGAKQLLARDAPAVDRAIDDVQKAKSERAVDDAVAAGKKVIAAVAIDAGFLDRKLQRLNAAYGALDAPGKARVSPKLSSASTLIASRKYAEANRALNEGFAAVGR